MTRQIVINNATFHIQHTLHTFLEEFVKDPEAGHIWIDQISIDQTNTRERNHQVQVMSEIYSQAAGTIIWLDPEDHEALVQIERAIEVLKRDEAAWYEMLKAVSPKVRYQLNKTEETCTKFNQHHLDVIGVASFFHRRAYWERLWIVQEIVLAQAVEIWSGIHRLSWTAVQTFWTFYQKLDRGLRTTGIEAHKPGSVEILAKLSAYNTRLPFVDCVVAFSGKNCRDLRDKIYGLQGIIIPEQRLKIDYSKSKEQVFLDAAYHIMLLDPAKLMIISTLADDMAVLPIYSMKDGFIDFDAYGAFAISALRIDVKEILSNAECYADWRCDSHDQLLSAVWLRHMLEDTILGQRSAWWAWQHYDGPIVEIDGHRTGKNPSIFIDLIKAYETNGSVSDQAHCSVKTWLKWLERRSRWWSWAEHQSRKNWSQVLNPLAPRFTGPEPRYEAPEISTSSEFLRIG